MDLQSHGPDRPSEPPTPEALLDALRAHPEWSERRRDEQFDRLVAAFAAEDLVAAVRPRLRDLSGGDGETVLRLVEVLGSPGLLEELAEALVAQPDLVPERAWEALELLQGSGRIEADPELAARRDELAELLDDEEGTLAVLAAQLEDDPDEAWVALQALGAVEPEVRAPIVAGLGRQPAGPGLVGFLRILAFAHDPPTRAAALEALEAVVPAGDPRGTAAWAEIAADHPDPDVVARARRRLGAGGASDRRALSVRDGPRIVASVVTALDGRGRGTVALAAEDRGRATAAAFLCDVERGVRDVIGLAGRTRAEAVAFLAEIAARPELDAVEEASELALGLLAASLRLCGPGTTPALRFWLERTVGPSFRAHPLPGPGPDPRAAPLDDLSRRAREILASCPSWVDDSDLTYDLAEELQLRERGAPPEPRRDAGAYRFLFEHRLAGRLELYRRMLTWMAGFWHAAGDLELGRSALTLAGQLADAQHAVPGHPFTVALTTRSLAIAQEHLRRGLDLRDPRTRARQDRADGDGMS